MVGGLGANEEVEKQLPAKGLYAEGVQLLLPPPLTPTHPTGRDTRTKPAVSQTEAPPVLLDSFPKSLPQVFLKSDDLCLTRDERARETTRPTLPSVRILAMHVQQLEIGAFTLATGAYKWNKLR